MTVHRLQTEAARETHWHALNFRPSRGYVPYMESRRHNEAEERDIVHPQRWIIQFKAEKRPAVKVILRHKRL